MATGAVDIRSILPSQEEMESMARRRYQHPNVHRTAAKRPQWYFRARVEVLTGPGQTDRVERIYYLGFCAEMKKRDAEKLRDQVLTEAINRPVILLQSQVKFGDIIAAYKRDHLPTLREVSSKSYACKIGKWIEPAFGQARLCDIDPLAIQKWVNLLPRSTKMRAGLVQHFRMIWDKAELWGYTQARCPSRGVSLGPRHQAYQSQIPTKEQYLRIKGRLPRPLDEMAELIISTGMRISEVRGLPVRAVDLCAGTVSVEQRKDALGYFDDPKTFKSRRVLPLGALASVLAARCRGKQPDDLVFADCGSYEMAQKRLRRVAGEVGFVARGFGWHSLRRAHNTWFRKSGGSVEFAMQQMGHCTSSVNDQSYLVAESGDFEERRRLVEALQVELMGTAPKGII